MKRFLLICLLWAFGITLAFGQAKVFTIPNETLSINGSSTITVTNTFQSIFAASQQSTRLPNQLIGRTGCTIQNNGTHNMNVFFGPIASATTANSVVLTPNSSVNCQSGGIVLQDQVSITGTSGDAFFAAQQ